MIVTMGAPGQIEPDPLVVLGQKRDFSKIRQDVFLTGAIINSDFERITCFFGPPQRQFHPPQELPVRGLVIGGNQFHQEVPRLFRSTA